MTARNSVDALYPPDRLSIREVGLRDGLQLVQTYPSTADKLDWIKGDHACGIRSFQVGSYLPADRFPQFADTDVLVDAVAALPGAHASALALNKRGAIRAIEGRVSEVNCVVSASEEHNLRNARRSRAASLDEIREVVALSAAATDGPLVSAAIAMGFGCSIEGDVAMSEVVRVVESCLDAGVDLIGIADTVGYAGPRQVRTLVRALRDVVGKVPLLMHFHDTRGMGIVNVAAALDEGVRVIDASLGGLGGCPFAPNATGNVVLEDVAFLAGTMGFDTGIDPHALVEVRAILERAMPGERLHGQIARAGRPLGMLRDVEAVDAGR